MWIRQGLRALCGVQVRHPEPDVAYPPLIMAQEVIYKLTDDLDGSDAEETISFALDGSNYEIDLNIKNAAALRKALDKYVAAARRGTTSKVDRRRSSGGRSGRRAM